MTFAAGFYRHEVDGFNSRPREPDSFVAPSQKEKHTLLIISREYLREILQNTELRWRSVQQCSDAVDF